MWLASMAELGGKPFPDEVRKSIKLILKGDRDTVTVGKNRDQGTVKLDPSAKPKAMDITGTGGPNKGKTIPATYELDGDSPKVCYDLSGKSRPTEFKTAEGTARSPRYERLAPWSVSGCRASGWHSVSNRRAHFNGHGARRLAAPRQRP
jgi:uncharacterized protein (TIGR03067 family)